MWPSTKPTFMRFSKVDIVNIEYNFDSVFQLLYVPTLEYTLGYMSICKNTLGMNTYLNIGLLECKVVTNNANKIKLLYLRIR